MVPDGWARRPLSEVLNPVSRVEDVMEDSMYQLMGVRWYGDGCHLHSTRAGRNLKTKRLNRVAFGDVTYNKMWVSKGAFAVVGNEHAGLFATSEYPTFEPTPDLDSTFFNYVMLSGEFQAAAQSRLKGSTSRARLNPRDFIQLRALIPPLPEQKRITAVLQSVDDSIEKTQAAIDQTEKVKKGLLQELLTRGMPGRHKRFKRTEIGEIPESWHVMNIESACEVRNNLRTPIKKADRAQMPGPYPYYGPTRAIDSLSQYKYEGQHVLLGEDGDHFLKFANKDQTQLVSGRFSVNNHAHVIRGVAATNEWLFNFFRRRDLREILTRQGVGRYKLKKSTLLELPLAVPREEEQCEISAVLSAVDDSIAAALRTVEGHISVKRGLMHDLLTGRVRVDS